MHISRTAHALGQDCALCEDCRGRRWVCVCVCVLRNVVRGLMVLGLVVDLVDYWKNSGLLGSL